MKSYSRRLNDVAVYRILYQNMEWRYDDWNHMPGNGMALRCYNLCNRTRIWNGVAVTDVITTGNVTYTENGKCVPFKEW
jgi:hypothetical protein